MINDAYTALAGVYENLICDDDYNAWASMVVETIKTSVNGTIGLDLACGSGFFTRALKRAGFKVTGVDISQEMLCVAKQKCQLEGLNIEFLCQDISKLKTFNKVDFVTIINDGINYLNKSQLERAFKAIRSALKPDGVLFFDFSTEYKLTEVIGNNLFGEDREDVSYLWFNSLDGDTVKMDLSFFIKDGDRYIKKEESHVQYVHTLDQVVGLLEKLGYKSIIAQNHMGGEIKKDTQRIQILARR